MDANNESETKSTLAFGTRLVEFFSDKKIPQLWNYINHTPPSMKRSDFWTWDKFLICGHITDFWTLNT